MAEEEIVQQSDKGDEADFRNNQAEEVDYTGVRFFRITLKHEVKTVEITTEQDRSAQLKSKNDYVLLKYFLELKVNEIEKNKLRKNVSDILTENQQDSTNDVNAEENMGLIISKQDNLQEYSMHSISISPSINPENVVEGKLIVVWPTPDTAQILEVSLAMHGIEAWLKNAEDYSTLLKVMRCWEESNMDYIQDLTANTMGGVIGNSGFIEGDSDDGPRRAKRTPGNFDFGDDSDSVEGQEVDMDALMRKKMAAKKLKNQNESSLVKEKMTIPSDEDKGMSALFKKFFCMCK